MDLDDCYLIHKSIQGHNHLQAELSHIHHNTSLQGISSSLLPLLRRRQDCMCLLDTLANSFLCHLDSNAPWDIHKYLHHQPRHMSHLQAGNMILMDIRHRSAVGLILYKNPLCMILVYYYLRDNGNLLYKLMMEYLSLLDRNILASIRPLVLRPLQKNNKNLVHNWYNPDCFPGLLSWSKYLLGN